MLGKINLKTYLEKKIRRHGKSDYSRVVGSDMDPSVCDLRRTTTVEVGRLRAARRGGTETSD